ncbi:MAG TPA: cytochrome c [Gemmatimonadetes bacterium]|nr:cytochrome c [Gemmatimonadota bacterium]HIB08903.1 cytochrome c [Gemmatimonadota bacterium]HIN78227.1 cytochrome c [Gemmatimonadota bacterium]
MNVRHLTYWVTALLVIPFSLGAQSHDASVANHELHFYAAADFGINPEAITFTKDIAPIFQRSCQNCHRVGGVAPMPLTTYEEVRRLAPRIKYRTAIRDRMGAMPPFFVEKDIGIHEFKNDPSLSDEELSKIQAWADNGAPEGDPADMPQPLDFAETGTWTIGEPDLVLSSREVTIPAIGPDWWGDIGLVPTGLTEDRYVQAVQVREVNDIPVRAASSTVGGRYMWHHMTYSSGVLSEDETELVGRTTSWPIHEVGRNADIFPEKAGRLLPANSALHLGAAHLHSNGRESSGHLEFGFKFFPEGYEPAYTRRGARLGNGVDIDVKPNLANQEFHSYAVLDEHTKIIAFEPHLHAPGVRMCIEAIWGHNQLTLNCVGYDHNWVKQYVYEDHAAPLLPKGTILHVIGFVDTTTGNQNIADARNWAGGGRRSVSNMFIDLGYSVELTEEQFQMEMAERRAGMKSRNEYDVGCPLCWAPPVPVTEDGKTRPRGNR